MTQDLVETGQIVYCTQKNVVTTHLFAVVILFDTHTNAIINILWNHLLCRHINSLLETDAKELEEQLCEVFFEEAEFIQSM